MNKIRIAQILGSLLAIGAVLPGGHRAAIHFGAYELFWLIPFVPAFTVTFFWIVVVMVGHFIAADPYKDPLAVRRAKRFLAFFDWFFIFVLAAFCVVGFFLYQFFSNLGLSS